MIDITHKSNTLREATAQAIVKVGQQATIHAIKNKTVPKGDVFAASKATGLLGVKKTADLLPDCHPMPIEYTGITFEIKGLEVYIYVTVKTIYKTGVEVEAMHGASIVALNIYDMLKPIDKEVEIHAIKLLNKTGGKSSFPLADVSHLKVGVIICSDSLSRGEGEDRSGKAVNDFMQGYGLKTNGVIIVGDEIKAIQEATNKLLANSDIVVISGGTGISDRDVSPEAILPLLDKRLIGVEEKIRSYGQDRMPYAMFSRSVIGTIASSLLLVLPGSTKGVRESLDAVFPALFHSFKVLEGERHN